MSTPASSENSIRALCRARMIAAHAANNNPLDFENRVVHSVEANLANGRFERVASHRSERHPLSLVAYIDRVISHVQQEQARIQALEAGTSAAWNHLYDLLLRRATSMMRRFDGNADPAEFAQQACLNIFNARYPFDVSFDAWATTILKNLVMAHHTRSTDALQHPHESLDAPDDPVTDDSTALGERVADHSSLTRFEQVETQMVFLNALAQLRSIAQRQVIRWSFLDEWSDDKIAKRLGKSKQAVYNIRKRALARLQEILTEPPQETPKKRH